MQRSRHSPPDTTTPANTGPRGENLARKRSLLHHQLGPLAACRKPENHGAQRLASSVTVCHHRPLGVARFHSRLCPLHQNSEAQSVKLSGVASRRSIQLSIAAVRLKAGAAVRRKAGCRGKAGAAGTAVAAVGGRHFGAPVARSLPLPVRLLEPTPWVLGLTVFESISRPRRDARFWRPNFHMPSVSGALRSKLGAKTIIPRQRGSQSSGAKSGLGAAET
jgi:hypothetical protein